MLPIWAWSGLAALFLVLSLTPVTNNDIWLHLANGRWILDAMEVPRTDPYSFPAAGRRFHAHEWLAGVIFYLVHKISGVPGLTVTKTAVWASTLGLVLLAARRLGARSWAMAAVTLLALVSLNQRFLERPEIFSFLWTAVYLLTLAREHRALSEAGRPGPHSPPLPAPGLGLWPLVPAQWLWVQLHGYFLTGLALVGTFLAAETIQGLWRRRGPAPPEWRRRLLSGWAALSAMGLVGLLNPNGLDAYLFPFHLAGGANIFMRTIYEWRPPFTSDEVTHYSFFLGFCAWLALLAVGAALGGGALRRRPLLARGVAIGGLLAVAGARVVLAAGTRLPAAAEALAAGALRPAAVQRSTGLPPSAWLWSPAELVGAVSGRPEVQSTVHALLAPLRWPGPWGDDHLTLLGLGLAALIVTFWRRPELPALAAVTLTLTFLLLQAGSWAPALLALAVGGGLAIGVIRGRVALWQAAVGLLFLVLAVRQNRNMANFVLVTMPLLAALVGSASGLPSAGRRGRGAVLGAVGLTAWALAAFTLWAGWPYAPRELKHPGFGVGPEVPVAAVGYLQQNRIEGNAFNKYAHGAYLIHQLFPTTRVFMDSRNGVYGPELFDLYRKTLTDPRQAAATFARYRFDYVLLDYEFYPGRSEHPGLLAYLRSRPEWVLVYFDDSALVYLPRRAGHQELIERDGYLALDPTDFRPGAFHGATPQTLREIEKETRSALSRRPASRSARLLRAEVLLVQGRVRDARELFESVLDDHPTDLYSRIAAGRLAARLGDPGKAVAHFRFVLGLRPGYQEVRDELLRLESTREVRP